MIIQVIEVLEKYCIWIGSLSNEMKTQGISSN
jgi:hypothetical protein